MGWLRCRERAWASNDAHRHDVCNDELKDHLLEQGHTRGQVSAGVDDVGCLGCCADERPLEQRMTSTEQGGRWLIREWRTLWKKSVGGEVAGEDKECRQGNRDYGRSRLIPSVNKLGR